MVRFCLLAALCALLAAPTLSAHSFTGRQLSDAHVGTTKAELLAQRDYSQRVVSRILDRSTRWRLAPRHRSCWSHVGWSTVCNKVRLRLFAHRWLYRLAQARLERLFPPSVVDVIRMVFVEDPDKAVAVSSCETGGTFSTSATNGQYYGLFQMGRRERARYGGSSSGVWDQVTAAHRYWLDAGWGPWTCA